MTTPSDLAGPTTLFTSIAAEYVAADVRARVDLAVRVAQRELELPPLKVQWHLPSQYVTHGTPVAMPERWAGWVLPAVPDTIHLRADWPHWPIGTVLHEARHLYQFARPAQFPTYAGREADAIQWATHALTFPAR